MTRTIMRFRQEGSRRTYGDMDPLTVLVAYTPHSLARRVGGRPIVSPQLLAPGASIMSVSALSAIAGTNHQQRIRSSA